MIDQTLEKYITDTATYFYNKEPEQWKELVSWILPEVGFKKWKTETEKMIALNGLFPDTSNNKQRQLVRKLEACNCSGDVAPVLMETYDTLTETIVKELKKRSKAHKPLHEDELTKMVWRSVFLLQPIEFFMFWGGCRQDKKEAGEKERFALEQLVELMPTSKEFEKLNEIFPYYNKDHAYPYYVTLIFCDEHATTINRYGQDAVDVYYNSLSEMIKTEFGDYNISLVKLSDELEIAKKVKAPLVVRPKFDDQDEKLKVKFQEAKKKYGESWIENGAEIFEKALKQYLYVYNAQYEYFLDSMARYPIQKMGLMFTNESTGEAVLYNVGRPDKLSPELFTNFIQRASKHANISKNLSEEEKKLLSKEIASEYINCRLEESDILQTIYNRGICLSFGDPESEEIFSPFPTIYLFGRKNKERGNPWFFVDKANLKSDSN